MADSKVILDKEIITECGKHAIACDVGYVEWKSFIEYQTQTDLYTCLVYITYIIRKNDYFTDKTLVNHEVVRV